MLGCHQRSLPKEFSTDMCQSLSKAHCRQQSGAASRLMDNVNAVNWQWNSTTNRQ